MRMFQAKRNKLTIRIVKWKRKREKKKCANSNDGKKRKLATSKDKYMHEMTQTAFAFRFAPMHVYVWLCVQCKLYTVYSYCVGLFFFVHILCASTWAMRNEKWQFFVKLNWNRRATNVNVDNVGIRSCIFKTPQWTLMSRNIIHSNSSSSKSDSNYKNDLKSSAKLHRAHVILTLARKKKTQTKLIRFRFASKICLENKKNNSFPDRFVSLCIYFMCVWCIRVWTQPIELYHFCLFSASNFVVIRLRQSGLLNA